MKDEQMPTLLHDLASGMPIEVEHSARRTVRRALRHRVVNVLVSATAVVAVVAGGVAALRDASTSDTGGVVSPGTTGVVPSTGATPAAGQVTTPTFAGLWPATTADELARIQAQVDEGHQPMLTDPAGTATELATNLFAWSLDDVQTEVTQAEDERFVDLRNSTFGGDVPPIRVDLAQLGRAGPDGVWSVVKVSSPLLFDGWTWIRPPDDSALGVRMSPSDLPEGAALRIEVLNGALPEPGSPAATATLSRGAYVARVSIAGVDVDSAVLWVQALDSNGMALGAMAVRLSSFVAAEAPDTAEAPLPAAVVAAHDAIQQAAADHDLETLATLIEPEVFAYDFGDGDPLQVWRDDPSQLDTIAQLLALPFWVNDTEGPNITYVWPAFMRPGALDHVSDTDRSQLHAFGFSDDQIDQMAQSGMYLGPRLGIREDGIWLYFVTGGD